MLSTLLITLREGLEASLIIGIIIAYLTHTGNRHQFKYVWLGTGLAIAVSLVAGAVIYFTVGKLEGRAEELFEGSTMFVAAGILTWMIFWMRRQSLNIKRHLHAQIESALGSGSSLGLIGLAFVTVAREGIETVLFLFAATKVTETSLLSVTGAFLGLALAVGIGYSLYRGTSRLNLRTFFNTTSILLILFGAGLLAHGVHEFHEAAIIPLVAEQVWDINHVIPEGSILGRFLTAIFGYNANPSLIEVISYFSFLSVTLAVYFRPAPVRKAITRQNPTRLNGLSA